MSSAEKSGNVAAAQPVCQFSGDACSTQSGHYRKVISHIFGRNKKCTVGIPDYVWIYYCRKHYQRARYRTAEWPFRQCDLAIDTVRNMREWGGVESFNLQLRRRETKRTSSGMDESGTQVQKKSTPGPSQSAPRSSPGHELEAATSPAPAPSLPTERPIKVEDTDEFDDIHTEATAEPAEDEAEEEEVATDTAVPASTPSKKKKSPTIAPRPVPDWLHSRIGERKTFDEILAVLQELRVHMLGLVDREEDPHFPDIEILPNLYPRAAVEKKSGHRRKSSTSTRISEKGAVKKTNDK